MWAWIGDASNAKLLGAGVIGCFSVLAIETITKAVIKKNLLFRPSRSMLSGIRLLGSNYPAHARPGYVKAFVASVLFYIIIDILLLTDFLAPSDVGKTTFARLSAFAFAITPAFRFYDAEQRLGPHTSHLGIVHMGRVCRLDHRNSVLERVVWKL